MKRNLAWYSPKLPIYLVYMLQQVEYNPNKFRHWVSRLLDKGPPINKVMHRKEIVYTTRAKMLIAAGYGSGVLLIASVAFLLTGIGAIPTVTYILYILIYALLLPFYIFAVLMVIVFLASVFIAKPKEKRLLARARKVFATHPGTQIAVAGSYGKTTLKEMLHTVLSQRFTVAATPGNMNTAVSQARFARKLTGKEDIVIVEYGEGAPGDVWVFGRITQPDMAVITGLAPNHLDEYKTVDAIANDLLSLREIVAKDKLYLSGESPGLAPYLQKGDQVFTHLKVNGWTVSAIKVAVTGTSFVMKKGSQTLKIHSELLGKHQVAPLALVASIAIDLGMTKSQVEAAIAQTKPYEHRMQPYQLSGATIIDDTYNGNLEGFLAGLAFLEELPAKRKIYVTPGLVDQGEETEAVHQKIGKTIAKTAPDIVVLMQNSVCGIIADAMKQHGYIGELRIEDDPLHFYKNIEHIVAAGDLVLMQNDWTDNYN